MAEKKLKRYKVIRRYECIDFGFYNAKSREDAIEQFWNDLDINTLVNKTISTRAILAPLPNNSDDGTEGQDRESYTDTQDRKNYTIEKGAR